MKMPRRSNQIILQKGVDSLRAFGRIFGVEHQTVLSGMIDMTKPVQTFMEHRI